MGKRGKKVRLRNLRITNCKLCKLHKSTKNVCILGKGALDAPVILIGEAPGEAEAKTGKPFMGRAGKLLDKLLKEVKLTNLVYITNVVHCRPPGNRTPSEEEINICSYFLGWEISIINPQILIPMGKVAMKGLGYYDISAGTKPFIDKEWSMWVNPTWHPAYCLRRGKAATNDLRKTLIWAKENIEAQ
jgi:DNA polymerase